MIQKVRASWIDGVLKKSLWNEARILLNLTSSPDAVIRPCDLAQRRAGAVEDTPIPPSTKIIEVYEKIADEELLILGEPGSGKTTLLLEIAEELLNRAEADPNHPIPVVFSLSTWRKKDAELTAWLVKQLNREYGVPEKIGRYWLENDELLLLLDGLDEVELNRRSKCVDAINTYRLTHQDILRPMVVCCRKKEYESIHNLFMNGAIIIQPLNEIQINDFLSKGEDHLSELRAIWQEDTESYLDLFNTPLMLNVVIMTFLSTSTFALNSVSPENRQKEIWDKYIEYVINRKLGLGRSYKDDYIRDKISWLGAYLQRYNQQIFMIEYIQPEDIENDAFSVIAKSCCFIFVLPILFIGMDAKFTVVLMLFWLGISFSSKIKLLPELFDFRLSDRGIFKRVFKAVIYFMIFGMLGSVIGMCLGFLLNKVLDDIDYSILFLLLGSVFASLWGGLVGVIGRSGVMDLLLNRYRTVKCFEGNDITETDFPNFGITRIFMMILKILFFMIFMISILGFVAFIVMKMYPVFDKNANVVYDRYYWKSSNRQDFNIQVYLVFLLACISVIFTYLCFFCWGVRSILQHYLTRIFISCCGGLPIRAITFLDWCADRGLLQRVGGGWRFIHRSLQEHFAERYYEKHPEERPKMAESKAGTA